MRRLSVTARSAHRGRPQGDRLAAAADLDPDKAREVLQSDAYADQVRRSTIAARRIGVNGVPACLVDDKVLIPGAQPHEIFDEVLGDGLLAPRRRGGHSLEAAPPPAGSAPTVDASGMALGEGFPLCCRPDRARS